MNAGQEAVEDRVLMIVPTLGRRIDLLRRTLESLHTGQGVGVDAVLVTPKAGLAMRELASHFGAKVTETPGHISAAVNHGLTVAGPQHRFAGWIGDDDLLRPGALARAVAVLRRDTTASAAFGACDYIDVAGATMFTRRPPPLAPWLMHLVPGVVKQEATLFRLTALREIGGLDESLRFAMDLDLMLRLQSVGPMRRVEATLGAFCWHPGSITIVNREASLVEAQAIQRRHAPTWLRPVFPLLQWSIGVLLRRMAARINARWLPDAAEDARG
ncbi:MAG: hypothetical protein AW12_02198 [Candidatus Accumulibacter sp. BA-94]|nr:MAG: hypothetical protein AW12_02198 [Candidatus Accumulibacter sp. BA-94]